MAVTSNLRSDLKITNTRFLIALLSIRLLLLYAIGWITDGAEFTDDCDQYIAMALHPLYQIDGTRPDLLQNPPLFGPLLALILVPVQTIIHNDFYAIRITYIAFEALGALLLLNTLQKSAKDSTKARIYLWIAIVLSPLNWMTSTIMAQDETVSFFLASATINCMSRKRIITALLIASFGVLAGKIFFLIIIGAIISIDRQYPTAFKAALSFTPIFLIYFPIFALRYYINGYIFPYSFSPSIVHCTSLWYFFVESGHGTLDSAKTISSLAALFILSIFALMAKQNLIQTRHNFYYLFISLCLTVFFLVFYHVTPEYLILIAPFALSYELSAYRITALYIIGIIAYGINFFHGVYWAGIQGGAASKLHFVNLYNSITDISPLLLQELGIICLAIALTTIALHDLFELMKHRQERGINLPKVTL